MEFPLFTVDNEKCKIDLNIKSNFQNSNNNLMNRVNLNGCPEPLYQETPPKFLMKNRKEKNDNINKNNIVDNEKCKIDLNIKSNFQNSNNNLMNRVNLNGCPEPLYQETPPKFLMKNRKEKNDKINESNLVDNEKCKIDLNIKSNFQNSNNNLVNRVDLNGCPEPLYQETPPKFLMNCSLFVYTLILDLKSL
ncbi:hypothetical protein PGAL8A_00271500 [Plasmodium gallinaceum]|uniref:Uncharacterized protein n=1 Tax=Plasmodium gallinaceum TaxID=5849 RepID=A0A1J1GTF8_PLAGA|nr:hypothetical protein PGAL8A_00271500 [Plasmodium gallinaceum]CRG95514.1 hypothetical protein PGAL8A_00271500 [Plasmodium gallinaceum]